MNANLNLKNQLLFYMKAYGITAAELSRRSKVSKQSISDWTAGVTPRSLFHLKRVANALHLTVDELCFGDASVSGEQRDGPQISDRTDQGLWLTGVFEGKLRRITLDEISRKSVPSFNGKFIK